MKIQYIKTSGEYFHYQPKGEQDPKCYDGVFKKYCIITKLSRGRFKIQYENFRGVEEVLVVYPAGIEHIKYFGDE
jgi:hypothetical protein